MLVTGNRGDQKARALWHVAPGRPEIREEPVGEPGAGEVRLRALHSGISRGSEALVFSGRVPPDEYERMKAPFMGGAFPFPVKYGYANVGRVEAGDAALAGRILAAREAVVGGQGVARALEAEQAATPTALKLMRAGEETGRLARMLDHASRIEADRADQLIRAVVRMLEPTLIIVFGGIVALVAGALLQAVYSVRPVP